MSAVGEPLGGRPVDSWVAIVGTCGPSGDRRRPPGHAFGFLAAPFLGDWRAPERLGSISIPITHVKSNVPETTKKQTLILQEDEASC